MAESQLGLEIEKIDADIDAQVKAMRDSNVNALDTVMVDKVLRPFVKALCMQRAAGADPREFRESAAWITAVLISETILSTTELGAIHIEVASNDMLAEMTRHLGSLLSANLSIKVAHVKPGLKH